MFETICKTCGRIVFAIQDSDGFLRLERHDNTDEPCKNGGKLDMD